MAEETKHVATPAPPRTPPCPECLAPDTGEENRGEGYCYACGFQWTLTKDVR